MGFLTVITEHVKGTDCLMLLTGSRDEILSNVFLCACVVCIHVVETFKCSLGNEGRALAAEMM